MSCLTTAKIIASFLLQDRNRDLSIFGLGIATGVIGPKSFEKDKTTDLAQLIGKSRQALHLHAKRWEAILDLEEEKP
jgi:hypothetical protein